jgi:Fe-S cluster biogenesis protein NfuA
MSIENKIVEVLNKIKPFLNDDGGDLEFVKFEDGIVYVRLLGACDGCAMADNTIKDMVEYTLNFEIPEVKEVRNII